jgi:phosphotriesterase-related protein
MGGQTVQTVLGPVNREDLGITLPHEHVLHNLVGSAGSAEEKAKQSTTVAAAIARFSPAERDRRAELWNQPISMSNLGDVRRNYQFYAEALRITDIDEVVEDALLFKDLGGGCIVDGTVHGMGPSPQGLVEVSRRSGVHIVASAGYYLYPYLPPDVVALSEDELFDRLLCELSDESESGVRAGALGEIGLSGPVHPVEEKMLRAAARVQAETGVGLAVHPGPGLDGALQAVEIVEKAGGDIGRTAILHVEHRLVEAPSPGSFDTGPFLRLAATGCYLSFDLFGREESYRQLGQADLPNDAVRVNHLRVLVDAGYGDRLLLSHDLTLRWQLSRYGGYGFRHIPDSVVRLMKLKGLGQELIDQFLVENPARWLIG